MSRVDSDILLDAEEAINESIQELMSVSNFHMPILLQRFHEYLPGANIPAQLSNTVSKK